MDPYQQLQKHQAKIPNDDKKKFKSQSDPPSSARDKPILSPATQPNVAVVVVALVSLLAAGFSLPVGKC